MKTIYDKNDLTHKHLDEICAICGARRGLHSHMNQRCPLKGAEETSADHTSYRDTVFTPAKSQPEQSFSRDKLSNLLELTWEAGYNYGAEDERSSEYGHGYKMKTPDKQTAITKLLNTH